MYFIIIFLPLIGSLFSGFFGYTLGRKNSTILSTLCIGITSILCWFLLINQLKNPFSSILKLSYNWISVGSLSINWGFLFDSVSIIMLVFITTISFIVHLYSIEYMKSDPHLCRFMSYISAFTFFMIILVTADNFLQLFLGWEGVGLLSYLLINFWYTRIEANKSAIKAMLINKIGDVGLLLGICFIYFSINSLDFYTVFSSISSLSNNYINFLGYDFNTIDIICFFLFIGCIGKSAQIGLHTWLPDAMEGPTPVSALIHAATMVTAGVFLLIRCSCIFENSENILNFIVVIGSLTCFISASIALVQNDLKKIIAYSTCSQLGYMIFCCGLSNYSVSLYHLANHAFFKALLFLSAGVIIHSINDQQDIRKMGGLINVLPFTYIMMLIGSLALMGFPFLSGFYSKDVILEVAYSNYSNISNLAFWLGSLSALGTAFYSFRLIYLVFYKKTNLSNKTLDNIHEAPILMFISLSILALGSIFVGYLSKDFFIGLGTHFWNHSIYNSINNINIIEAEFLSTWIKLIPILFSIIGALISILLYNKYETFLYFISLKFYNLYNFINNKYYFDIIYNNYIVKPLLSFGYSVTYKLIDKGLLELIGPYGISNLINSLSLKIVKLQTGLIYNYSLIMLTSVIIYMNILIFHFNILSLDLLIINSILAITYLYIKK